MPFKKMTIREQREAKRELIRLRRMERTLRDGFGGTSIASGELCTYAGGAIAAAIRLGHIIVVRGTGNMDTKKFTAYAYKLGEL